jgi:RNA polymerase sigma-70 factor (ECF subfamily)
VRAKRKIRNAAIPYRVPPRELLSERVSAVLAVVYLLFNEGYSASTGDDLVRGALCDEAIRLCRTIAELMPDEPEVLGLLALMLLHDSRRAARVDAHGDIVLLEDQNRARWDHDAIDAGLAALDRALALRNPGPYQVQAAIAACHARAPVPEATDWPQIAGLYGQLARMTPSPVVELNRAVAVAMADGPGAGLALLEPLLASGVLGSYYLLHAARADLLRRAGRFAEASAAYEQALTLVGTAPERRFLDRRLAEVRAQDAKRRPGRPRGGVDDPAA